MDVFLKNKYMGRFIIFLIILNLGLTAYLFLHHHPQPVNEDKRDPQRVAAILKKELSLTPAQDTAMQVTRVVFYRAEKEISDLIKSQRDSMNEMMFSGVPDSLVLDAMSQRVAHNEYRMEQLRIRQGMEIRALLNPAQRKKLEALVFEIRDYFQPAPRKEEK